MRTAKSTIILTLFVMTYVTNSNARTVIQRDDESALQMQQVSDHVVRTKQFIGDFYTELKNKTPVLNVEEEFKLNVSHDNAAEVLAFALIMRGNAPQTHCIFTADYDPYKPCVYPNPYQQVHVMTAAPETEEGASRLEKLNEGLATHWPEFVQQMKVVNKARRQRQSETSGQQIPTSSRKRSAHCLSDEFFNAPDQSETTKVNPPTPVNKKRKFSEHLMNPDEMVWVSRKRR